MNLWLCDTLLSILSRNTKWLYQFPTVVTMAFYGFCRVILDHSKFLDLRKRESAFVNLLLRERVSQNSGLRCNIDGVVYGLHGGGQRFRASDAGSGAHTGIRGRLEEHSI